MSDDVGDLEERLAALEADPDADPDDVADVLLDLAYAVAEVEGPLPGIARYQAFLERSDDLDGWDDARAYALAQIMWAYGELGREADQTQVAATLHRRHLDHVNDETAEFVASAVSLHAHALADSGRRDAALQLLERATDRIDPSALPDAAALVACRTAAIVAHTDAEKALTLLRTAQGWFTPPHGADAVWSLGTIATQEADVHGERGEHRAAIELLEGFLDRFGDRDDAASRLEELRWVLGYHRVMEARRLLRRVGQAAEAERQTRRAVADGYYAGWLEVASAIAAHTLDLDQEEHALQQARATAAERAPGAALRLGQVLAYGRGDRDAARVLFAEVVDRRSEYSAWAAAELQRLDRPVFALRRARWWLRRRRRRFWRASRAARAIARLTAD